MSLISMAVWDTEENGRTEYTKKTIDSLLKTVDFNKHRMFIVDNKSCEATQNLYKQYISDSVCEGMKNPITIIFLPENIGTARAINQAWKLRQPGENCIKMDNDVVIHSAGWVDEMDEAIKREPIIGILGLKRKDIIQTTWHPEPGYRSELIMLPHEPGQRWINFEKTDDVIGTCTMFNSALLDKVGYSYQPGIYGYEDVLFCHRSHLAGFMNGFLNHIDIDHIDSGTTPYQHWKEKHSSEHTEEMIRIFNQYKSGERSIYEKFN